MKDLKIIENDGGIVVLSDSFRIGKGFIFPYGRIEIDNNCFNFALPSFDPETHQEAFERLEALNRRAGQGSHIRKPELNDLAYIFSFISGIPDADLEFKFIDLLTRNPFFGFETSYLIRPRGEILIGPSNLLDLKRDQRVRRFSHEFCGKTENYTAVEILSGYPNFLERVVGENGIGNMRKLVRRLSPVCFEGLKDVLENPSPFFNLPKYYNDVQVESVSCLLSSDVLESYSTNWVKGVPYVQLESTLGTEPERGVMIYDNIRFAHDFWGHHPTCVLYGYTFGIVE